MPELSEEHTTATDFFETIGQKASQLDPSSNGVKDPEQTEAEPKVVEEVESLCMNCHENVCLP